MHPRCCRPPVNPVELAGELPLRKETKLQQLCSSVRIDTCKRNGNRDWNRHAVVPERVGFFFLQKEQQKFGEINISSQLME